MIQENIRDPREARVTINGRYRSAMARGVVGRRVRPADRPVDLQCGSVGQRSEQHDGEFETSEHDGADNNLFADKDGIHQFSSSEDDGKGYAPRALRAKSFRLYDLGGQCDGGRRARATEHVAPMPRL